MDDCSFGVTGLRLQGAQCVNNKLSVIATIINELPLCKLQWIRVNTSEMYKMSQGKVKELLSKLFSSFVFVTSQVTLPVYLNQTRSELLFTLDFDAEGVAATGDHSYYERGVAILSSPL